jgi:hypothetical protein
VSQLVGLLLLSFALDSGRALAAYLPTLIAFNALTMPFNISNRSRFVVLLFQLGPIFLAFLAMIFCPYLDSKFGQNQIGRGEESLLAIKKGQ